MLRTGILRRFLFLLLPILGFFNAILLQAAPLQPLPSSTLIINEVDVETPGTDKEEFIELYDGGIGSTNLNGLVIVLFNGQDDRSYRTIDLSGHQSRPLIGEEIREAELILCMEKGHADFVKTFFPWHRDRIFLVGAWPNKENRKSPVEDPVGAPVEVFRQVFERLNDHILRILRHL